MGNDKRRALRRSLERTVWIDCGDGSPFVPCVLGNVSDTGAKLVLSAPSNVPEEFVVRISPDGRVVRKCRTAWRSGNEIGIHFVGRNIKPAAVAPISAGA